MANTLPYRMTLRVVDSMGVLSSVPLYGLCDPTATLAQVVTEAQAVQVALDAVTDAVVYEVEFGVIPANAEGIKSSALNNCNVEKTGLYTFNDSETPANAYGQDVPAVALSTLSGDKIDPTNADVMAWVAALTTAWTKGVFTTRAQSVVAAIRRYNVTFRKRRRAQSRVSLEPAG